MHIKLLIIILLFSLCSKGQETSFPDYKGEKESFSKIKDKTIRKEVAGFTIAGSGEKAAATTLKEIPLKRSGSDYSIFEKDSIYIKLTAGKFIKSKHKIKYAGPYAVKIDNKPIWGMDGGLPKTQINSIEARIGKDTVMIPLSAYQDLYEPSLAWKESGKTVGGLSVYYSKDKRRIYIAMSNSDGAGFYEATLIIKDKKYSGRVLDTGF